MAIVTILLGFPCSSVGKVCACSAGDPGSIPGLGRFPRRRKSQPTPVSTPGKSHGQRSLVDYSPWGRKESGTTEWLTLALTYLTQKREIFSLSSLELNLHMCSVMSDCSPRGSTVLGIFQARLLERVAISSSREFSPPWHQTHILHCRQILNHWAAWKSLMHANGGPFLVFMTFHLIYGYWESSWSYYTC